MELSKKIYSFGCPNIFSEQRWKELQPKQQQIVHGLAVIQLSSKPLALKLRDLFARCDFNSPTQVNCDSCKFTFSITSRPSCVGLTVTTSDSLPQSPFPLLILWTPAGQTKQNRFAETQLKIALAILSQTWQKPTASAPASSNNHHPQTLRGKIKDTAPPRGHHQRSNSLTHGPSQRQKILLLLPCVLDQPKEMSRASQTSRNKADISLSMKNGQFRQEKRLIGEIEKLMTTLPNAKWGTSKTDTVGFRIEYTDKDGVAKAISAQNLSFLRFRLNNVCNAQNKKPSSGHPRISRSLSENLETSEQSDYGTTVIRTVGASNDSHTSSEAETESLNRNGRLSIQKDLTDTHPPLSRSSSENSETSEQSGHVSDPKKSKTLELPPQTQGKSPATNWTPLLITVALVGLGVALWKIRQASTKPTSLRLSTATQL